MAIYEALIHQSVHCIATISTGSVLDGLCFITVANYIHPRPLTSAFITTSAMFLITGAVYYVVNHSSAGPAAIVMLGLSHFALYSGECLYNPEQGKHKAG